MVAVRDGRRFTWNDPLRVSMEVKQSEQGWNVQQLDCHSSFLQLTGQGTPRAGSFELTCDLDRLVSELHQLFDLGALQAAGAMSTQLRWQRNDDGRVAVSGASTIENLELATTPDTNWREPHLQATLSLEAEADGQRLDEHPHGTYRAVLGYGSLGPAVARAGGETLDVMQCGRSAVWCEVRWPTGSLECVRSCPVCPWMAAVPCSWNSRRGSRHRAGMSSSWYSTASRCVSVRPGVNIDEQTVHVELAGRWDFGLHQGSIPNALFQSSALALRATDVGWNLEATQPQLTGDISFRADLTRLQTSWQVPSAQQNWRVAGAAQGQVSLVQHEGSTQARWSIDLADAELARRTGTTTPDMSNVIPAAKAAAWRLSGKNRR